MPVFEEINGIQYGSGIKTVLYGQEGVGKSSLAANIPGIVFIDCEGSTTKMNVRRLPAPTSWAMLCDEMEYILQNAAVNGVGTLNGANGKLVLQGTAVNNGLLTGKLLAYWDTSTLNQVTLDENGEDAARVLFVDNLPIGSKLR